MVMKIHKIYMVIGYLAFPLLLLIWLGFNFPLASSDKSLNKSVANA